MQGAARQQPPSDAEPFDFGGLPAPWEPFPSWITDTFAPAPSLNAAAAALPLSGLTAQPPASSAPLVQRAGEERSLEPPRATPDAAPAHTAAPHATPPDLDELARQVYGILRRRLAAEARRAG